MPTCLVTGDYSGPGLGLGSYYLSQSNNIVIAGVRQASCLIILKIDSASETSAQVAVDELRTKQNIEAIDVAIVNSPITTVFPEVLAAKSAETLHHYKFNVIRTVLFFQVVLPLLRKSKNPKFVSMGSSAGQITGDGESPFLNSVYGVTKAALNYIVKRIHLENEGIIAFAIDPSFVQTIMGNAGARHFGLEMA